MSDRTFPLIVGAGAAAAYFWYRKKRAEASPTRETATTRDPWTAPPPPLPTTQPPQPQPSPIAPQLTGRWVWPVPRWQGRTPVISSGWGSPRPGGPHRGGDIMFKRMRSDPFPVGSPNGSKSYVMPDNLLAVAASDGVVWSAEWGPGGFHVVIDHGPQKVATYYQHLSELLVTPTSRAKSGQRVYAGQPLGIIGASPRDRAKLKHLHFAIWLGGPDAAVDPAPVMQSWAYIEDPHPAPVAPAPKPPAGPVTSPSQVDPPKPPAGPVRSPSEVPRNSSLSYRPIGNRGAPYPEWVRALDGRAGVYVIRELDGDVVYVGSSTGRLYDTLTRHFQTWRRWKGFWKGQYGEGHDPGLTYDRNRVEVAVRLTAPSDALEEEERLIRRLRPRDNLLLQPEEEPVPF